MSIPRDISPSELILARRKAFEEGDFGFIFDSYHPDSNFRSQFPDREAYLAYGRQALASDFVILSCRILKERSGEEETLILLYLESSFRGERQALFEAAHFLKTSQGWRYHWGEKLERSGFSGPIEELGWEEFEKATGKILF